VGSLGTGDLSRGWVSGEAEESPEAAVRVREELARGWGRARWRICSRFGLGRGRELAQGLDRVLAGLRRRLCLAGPVLGQKRVALAHPREASWDVLGF